MATMNRQSITQQLVKKDGIPFASWSATERDLSPSPALIVPSPPPQSVGAGTAKTPNPTPPFLAPDVGASTDFVDASFSTQLFDVPLGAVPPAPAAAKKANALPARPRPTSVPGPFHLAPPRANEAAERSDHAECTIFSIHSVSASAQMDEEADERDEATNKQQPKLGTAFPDCQTSAGGNIFTSQPVDQRGARSRPLDSLLVGDTAQAPPSSDSLIAPVSAAAEEEESTAAVSGVAHSRVRSSMSFHSPAPPVGKLRRGSDPIEALSTEGTAADSERGPTATSTATITHHPETISRFTLPSILPTPSAPAAPPATAKDFGLLRPVFAKPSILQRRRASGCCDPRGLRQDNGHDTAGLPSTPFNLHKPGGARKAAGRATETRCDSAGGHRHSSFLHSFGGDNNNRTNSNFPSTTSAESRLSGLSDTGSLPAPERPRFSMAVFNPFHSLSLPPVTHARQPQEQQKLQQRQSFVDPSSPTRTGVDPARQSASWARGDLLRSRAVCAEGKETMGPLASSAAALQPFTCEKRVDKNDGTEAPSSGAAGLSVKKGSVATPLSSHTNSFLSRPCIIQHTRSGRVARQGAAAARMAFSCCSILGLCQMGSPSQSQKKPHAMATPTDGCFSNSNASPMKASEISAFFVPATLLGGAASLTSASLLSGNLPSDGQRVRKAAHKSATPARRRRSSWMQAIPCTKSQRSHARRASGGLRPFPAGKHSRSIVAAEGEAAAKSSSTLLALKRPHGRSAHLSGADNAATATVPVAKRVCYNDELMELVSEAMSDTLCTADGHSVLPPSPVRKSQQMQGSPSAKEWTSQHLSTSSWSTTSSSQHVAGSSFRHRRHAVKVLNGSVATLVSISASTPDVLSSSEWDEREERPHPSPIPHLPYRPGPILRDDDDGGSVGDDITEDSYEQRLEEEEGNRFAAYYMSSIRGTGKAQQVEEPSLTIASPRSVRKPVVAFVLSLSDAAALQSVHNATGTKSASPPTRPLFRDGGLRAESSARMLVLNRAASPLVDAGLLPLGSLMQRSEHPVCAARAAPASLVSFSTLHEPAERERSNECLIAASRTLTTLSGGFGTA